MDRLVAGAARTSRAWPLRRAWARPAPPLGTTRRQVGTRSGPTLVDALNSKRELWKEPDGEPRFLDMIKGYFEQAGQCMDFDDGELERITGCDAVIRVSFPFRRDDGRTEVVSGYRAQHSHHRLPVKVRRARRTPRCWLGLTPPPGALRAGRLAVPSLGVLAGH
jgi:hypothetical protein